MKRFFIGLGCASLVAASLYGAFWLTQSCRPLDRLFGFSGCAESHVIADFVALDGASISPPQVNGDVSIFGEVKEGALWKAAVVRFNLDTGVEGERHPVATDRDLGTLVFSADGERAVLTCFTVCVSTMAAGLPSLALKRARSSRPAMASMTTSSTSPATPGPGSKVRGCSSSLRARSASSISSAMARSICSMPMAARLLACTLATALTGSPAAFRFPHPARA